MPSPSRPSSAPLFLSLVLCALGLGALACVVAWVAQKASRNGATAFAHVRLPAPPTLAERIGARGMASRGQAVFEAQACGGCHGKFLEGGAGPCLTDAAWIKGSRDEDILNSINAGSNEKGMPAFANTVSEDDKAALIAFIRSRDQGLRQVAYRVYDSRGEWKQLPDFSQLKPAAEGVLKDDEQLSVARFGRKVNFGAVCTARLKVPATGTYTFHLGSDDGSALYVDGQLVVDNDGLHNDKKKLHGSAELKAGDHAVELRYFQGGVDATISLAWDGPVSAGFLSEPVVAPDEMLVTTKARVMRGDLNRSLGTPVLAIGLPGGLNASFDAGHGAFTQGWHGAFMNVSGTRDARGGRPNAPLETPVPLTAGPLVRLAEHPDEAPRFEGYEIAGKQVVLHLSLRGARCTVTVDALAGGKGLVGTLAFTDPVPGPLLLPGEGGQSRTVPAAQAAGQTIPIPF